ncbi:MAG: DHH family phosphoesterase [Oscillospiraceae bacterium]|nr:DHH family phosphoesterase [Oscillospiraceae bacterium]
MSDQKPKAPNYSKIQRALMPNSRMFLLFLIIFAVATFFFSDQLWLSIAEGVIILILIVYSLIMQRTKRKALMRYIESVTYDAESAKNNTLQNFPLPMAVFRPADSKLIWANQNFFDVCNIRKPSVEMCIVDVIPAFSGRWLMEGSTQCPELLEHNGRKYQIHGNLVRTNPSDETGNYMGITYWVDVTDYEAIREEYYNSRPMIGLFVIDNYDELIRGLSDRKRNELRDAIEDKLLQWCDGKNGFFRRYDRERYLFVFEERHLEKMREDQFSSLLDSVHSIVSPTGIHATVSVGIGRDGSGLEENYNFALLGVEMALSRGGDQAVVKNRVTFEFFGGRGSEIETRTKVKSRVMANALSQLIGDSSKVYVMGHKYSDLDSVGAAVGICCIARKLNTPCRIVIDQSKTAAHPLLEKISKLPEYSKAFLTPQDAILHADSHTLLVVVDTNRPDQVENQALLESCTRVAVIDHHRRAAEYIANATMSFHEPYASSAGELVAELLEEIVEQPDILRAEAEALLAGMMLDTKNFTIRTGERTFEAAAFLRRTGADTSEVKKLLQSDMAHTVAKYRILQNAKIYRSGIAIAVQEQPQDRVVAAQAADELLNVAGVDTSIVVYPVEDGVFMSARSIGDVNVQILMEKLGGGGNRASAAVQLSHVELPAAVRQLRAAIDDYFEK